MFCSALFCSVLCDALLCSVLCALCSELCALCVFLGVCVSCACACHKNNKHVGLPFDVSTVNVESCNTISKSSLRSLIIQSFWCLLAGTIASVEIILADVPWVVVMNRWLH